MLMRENALFKPRKSAFSLSKIHRINKKREMYMATTRLIPLHTGKGRNFGKAIRNVIGYVSNPKKTHQGELVTGSAVIPKRRMESFYS